MARGILFPAGLTVLIVVLVLVFHQTCSAEDSDHLCPPSSCGNIPNISYPFRLEGDPENCGDQRYNLSCENNQTVLKLYAGKYYVREINYTNYKIRVVDPGILNDNDSFIARYPLDIFNFSSEDPYQTSQGNQPGAVVFLNCEEPVNSPWYFDITCLKNGVYSSNSSLSRSKKYTYFLLSDETGDVEDLCQVAQISVSPWRASNSPINMSCAAVRNELVLGFELLWYRAYCESRCGRHGSCDLDEAANIVSCYRNGVAGILYILESTYNFIMYILAGPMNIIYEKLYDQLYYEGGGGQYKLVYDKVLSGETQYVLMFDKALINNLLKFMTMDYGLFQAVKMILGTPFVIAFLIYKWRRRHLSMYDVIEEFLQSHNNLTPIRYSYSEVRKMTKSFKEKLGEGGYGTVYKGTLRSGRLVAIKMLNTSKTNGQDFISEVATIGRIHHVNVVQLIGFCVERSKRALVYEFMPNGSLNKYIFLSEVSTLLSFDRMYDIALGVARGIEYLHQGCDMQILHFDIKPHNILLDENFTPKISDFGLAKLYPVNNSIVSLTAARGTLGYMAPELFYKNIGSVSYKADVYSFGMLLMEMAGRRKNLNALAEHSSQIYFPTWVYDQLNDGNNIEMEDATEEERKIGKKMIIVALWCIQMKPSDRLPMNKVIHMLEGEVECLQMPSKPFLSSLDRVITGGGENSNQSNESSQSSQF